MTAVISSLFYINTLIVKSWVWGHLMAHLKWGSKMAKFCKICYYCPRVHTIYGLRKQMIEISKKKHFFWKKFISIKKWLQFFAYNKIADYYGYNFTFLANFAKVLKLILPLKSVLKIRAIKNGEAECQSQMILLVTTYWIPVEQKNKIKNIFFSVISFYVRSCFYFFDQKIFF